MVGRVEDGYLLQQEQCWPVQHDGRGVADEKEGRRKVVWVFEGLTAGERLVGIPDEWKSVWTGSTAGPVGVLGMALESTVEPVIGDDPQP